MKQRTFRITCLSCAVVVSGFVLWVVAGVGGLRLTTFVDDWSEFLAAALACGACGYAFLRGRGLTRMGWLLMGLSTGSWAIGEAIWSWYETVLDVQVPFPSLADVGFLAAVPLEVAAVLLFATRFAGTSRLRTLLDGLIIAGSLFFISWVTVLHAVYAAAADTPLAMGLSLAYPVGDIVTAVILLTVVTHSKRLGGPLVFVALGLFALTISDSTFAYLTATSAFATNPVDSGWVAGFLLIGLGALRSVTHGTPEVRADLSRLRAAVPYLPLGVAVAMTAAQVARDADIDKVAIWTLLTVGVLVLVRQLIAIVEALTLSGDLEASLTALRDREAKLEHQALHDALTGLANRRLFQDRIEHALSRSKRTGNPVGLLFLDLDDFKTVNDTMGHAAGDRLIAAAAERLRGCTRPGDTVGRLGGDEFGVLLEDLAEDHAAPKVAKRILDAFEPPFSVQQDVYVSLSIGIVQADGPGATVSDMLRDADAAMYAAKNRGKGRYAVFEESLRTGFAARLELRNRLARAVENREISVHYQPVFDLASQRLVGAEALARWQSGGESIPPAEFIPLAEETGLINAVGRQVLERACAEAVGWPGNGQDLSLSVNVSAHQLNHPGFVDDVRAVLEESGLHAQRLVLEITENVLMLDTALVLERLNRLAEVGVRLAIDDFGTGYSALHYLQRFPISIVKIDRSFVNGLSNPTNRAVVASIAGLCESLGMVSIAEGIETDSQFDELKRLACKAGQGYLLGRPVPAEAMRGLAHGDGDEKKAARKERRAGLKRSPLPQTQGLKES